MNYDVLIMSCDKYLSLLDTFFKYFSRFFDTEDVNIYVSLEEKSYTYPGLSLNVLSFPNAKSWSHRLRLSLEQMHRKSVLVLMDDFILEEPTDMAELRKLDRLMTEHDNIAHFALTTVPMRNESNEIYYDRYYKRHRMGRYKVTMQAGFWNRQELIHLVRDRENPWKLEYWGSIRSILSNRDYYAIASAEQKPLIYNDGFFCLQGKLNDAEITRLSEKFGEQICISGIPSNHGVIVRNATPLPRRIIGRIKVTAYHLYYLARYYSSAFFERRK